MEHAQIAQNMREHNEMAKPVALTYVTKNKSYYRMEHAKIVQPTLKLHQMGKIANLTHVIQDNG